MKHQRTSLSLIGLILLQSFALGQLQFSGFADILLVSPFEEHASQTIQYGQFELDLSANIRPGVNFEGAMAYNPETGNFEAGAGFIELVFTGEDGLHSARGKFLDHIGLSIGQFDVPFGIDWQHIASPDRRLVTAPLQNEMSINGWNDMGFNFHADMGKLNMTAFLVNGASHGHAIGGRVAYSFFKMIDWGTSYFTQTEANHFGSTPQVFGADLQTKTGPLATRFEVHYSEDLFEGDFDAIDSIQTHHGFYFQSDLDLSSILNIPVIFIGRYDEWSTLNNIEEANRITIGAAYTVTEGFEIRGEYLEDIVSSESTRQQIVLQTLVSF